MGTGRGHKAVLSEQGEDGGSESYNTRDSFQNVLLTAVRTELCRSSAGGMPELHPGAVDKRDDALHVRDQRLHPGLCDQAGWYTGASRGDVTEHG